MSEAAEAEVIQSPGNSIADEMYAPAPEPETPVVDKQPVSDSDDTPAPDDQVVEADDLVVEPTDDESVDSEDITTLSQLAEHLETDPEFFQGLKMTHKMGDKEVEFSISDAIDTHMRVEAGEDYLSNAKLEAKSIVDAASGQEAAIAGTAATFGALLVEAEKMVIAGQPDWEKLRVDDPAEYSAKRHDFQQRIDELDGLKRRAVDAVQTTAADAATAHQAQLDKALPAQIEKLHGLLPDWAKDEAKATKEQEAVHKYLADRFTPEEVTMASYDGGLLALAVKAMRYDNAKVKSDAARKKVTKIPKMLKPGTKKDESNASSDKTDRVGILYG